MNNSGSAVTFYVKDDIYAFDMACIREINARSGFTFVPTLPDCICGVINLMGEVIPVIDLCKRLNLGDEDYSERSCLLVISSGDDTAAIRVREVITSITYTEGEDFMPMPEKGIYSGIITDEKGNRITLLDAEQILDIKG